MKELDYEELRVRCEEQEEEILAYSLILKHYEKLSGDLWNLRGLCYSIAEQIDKLKKGDNK